MPLVRISLREGKSEQYKKALADGVHRAMVEDGMRRPVSDGMLYAPKLSTRSKRKR